MEKVGFSLFFWLPYYPVFVGCIGRMELRKCEWMEREGGSGEVCRKMERATASRDISNVGSFRLRIDHQKGQDITLA